jgi:hypothetical protein
MAMSTRTAVGAVGVPAAGLAALYFASPHMDVKSLAGLAVGMLTFGVIFLLTKGKKWRFWAALIGGVGAFMLQTSPLIGARMVDGGQGFAAWVGGGLHRLGRWAPTMAQNPGNNSTVAIGVGISLLIGLVVAGVVGGKTKGILAGIAVGGLCMAVTFSPAGNDLLASALNGAGAGFDRLRGK